MSSSLVVVSASDRESLLEMIARIVRFLDRMPETALVDVAYTCSLLKGAERLSLVVDNVADLRSRLVSAHARLSSLAMKRIRDKSGTYYFEDRLLGEGRGKLAFVYPGVMSFYPDMLRDLAIEMRECRSAFDELEEAMIGDAEFAPSSFVFPPASYYRHDADIFSSGAYAQALVAVYSAGVGMTRLLRSYGLLPDGVVGFAGGDLAAMVRSGAAGESRPRTERVSAIAEIYRIVDKAVDHAGLPETVMVTVLIHIGGETKLAETLSTFPNGKVTLALDLSPRQKTYAIDPDFADEAIAAFNAAGIRSMRLALNRPFNTPKCASLVPAIQKFTTKWMKEKPSTEVYSCSTAEPVPDTLAAARKDTAERWSRPVRFADTVRRMYADGYRVFVEVGPRGLMTSFIEDTLKGCDHAAFATNSIHRRGMLQLQHAVAQLMALGADMDISSAFAGYGPRKLDFDATVPISVRHEAEMLLSRRFPRLTLLSDVPLEAASVMVEPKGRGAKVAARQAAINAQSRRHRQFDFGAVNPLVSDADIVSQTPGVSIEIKKTFSISDAPFIGDFSIGTSQLSYSDPNLRGLVLLTVPIALEIMAETAALLVPGRAVVAIEDISAPRNAVFSKGVLTLFVKAERVASGSAGLAAVRVFVRDDRPDSAYTSANVAATFVLSKEYPSPAPLDVVKHSKPRTVHWSSRDVYPSRLCSGKRLRNITFVETWSESGVDYTIKVPPIADAVTFTRFPNWVVNPLLLGSVVSGFPLWRSHERFPGACSFPFRCRRIDFLGPLPKEGSEVKCYMRLTGVTPTSQISDITVSGGNGLALMNISGWEELCERVNPEYRDLIMQPATSFITRKLGWDFIGNPSTDVATAYVTDIPYHIFEKTDEIWLKTFSHIVLCNQERLQFADKMGSASRRTEWLFGRIAAKEAVRRYLKDFHQARWSYADVEIMANDKGKPYALGDWQEFLQSDIDIAIAHTAQFIVAVAAANARVGVDVESAERNLSEEFAAGVFMPEELELAAQSANASQSVIRFWCAKEAVSKALGTGIRYSPKEMNVESYQADSGSLAMRLTGEWEKSFPQFKGRDINVTVRNLHEHVLAFCFIPSTMFPQD